MSGRGFIAAEKPQQCDDCGEIKELRPYGPNGSCICFKCSQKDPEGTEKRMGEYLFGKVPEGPNPAKNTVPNSQGQQVKYE